jgi:hypothetical protein
LTFVGNGISTAPPWAKPGVSSPISTRLPDFTAARSISIADWPPSAETSSAVHTCSPADSRARIESDVAVPGP